MLITSELPCNVRIARQLRCPEMKRPLDPKNDPKNYILRIFYHNPEDKSLMVPMRFGSGVDFNYARWPGKVFALVLAVGFLLLLTSIIY